MTVDVFESPDGGHTVYVRRAGSSQRELYSVSAEKLAYQKAVKQQQLWRKILATAEHDDQLREMLDQIEVFYALKNSP